MRGKKEGKMNKHGKPQTRLTELIDGDMLEEDRWRLLKESVGNNLPWVCCVKSISTASKVAIVTGIPYWPVNGRQLGGRESILSAIVGGQHELSVADFIGFSHLAFLSFLALPPCHPYPLFPFPSYT